MTTRNPLVVLAVVSLLLVACGDDSAADDAAVDSGRDVSTDTGEDAGDGSEDAGDDAGDEDVEVLEDVSEDVPPVDPCEGRLLCETFDDYDDVTTLSNDQRFGPWRAAQRGASVMDLDTTRAVSGDTALHVSIDAEMDDSGGRLFAGGDHPLFEGGPTQMHGRMMMYVEQNGHSVHWTFGGVSGPALEPHDGLRSTYLFSSLRDSEQNMYSTVNYINTPGTAQDCWHRSGQYIEAGRWMCLEWSVDTEGRTIEMKLDGEPLISLEGTGDGCVGSVANDSPWVGPTIDQFYVGYWSFHPFTGAFEAWVDDVIVDDEPVPCP